ncbi:MAG: hypothetical protein U0S12_05580 [Fimbriimonadales bacterium]
MSAPDLCLVAVNMKDSFLDIANGMYLCPATEGGFVPAHAHVPVKYMACCVQQGAKYIGEVIACVRLNRSQPDEVLWKFGEDGDAELIVAARAKQKISTSHQHPPCLVFLLGRMAGTDFVRDKAGGLQNSCVVFDLTDLAPADLTDLAAKLRSVPWSALPRLKEKKVRTPALA